MESLPILAIVDLGSQFTLVIERTFRELGVRSVVLDPKRAAQWLQTHPVRAIVLSGGPAGVYEQTAPQPPEEIFSVLTPEGEPVPILGICYGMQWLVNRLGGEVKNAQSHRGYGKARIRLIGRHELFEETDFEQSVWESHGDSVVALPPGFKPTAHTLTGVIAGMVNELGTIWGLQFHPEVTHTQFGKQILANFLRLCRCEPDWQPAGMINQIRQRISKELEGRTAIFGFSGGVDSTTVGAILPDAIAVTIDGGQLRENELAEIKRHAQAAGIRRHIIVDAKAEFLQAMAGLNTRWRRALCRLCALVSPSFAEWLFALVDAERKRSAFKRVYLRVLMRVAAEVGATIVIQGTLAPDRIESGATGGAMIKSHHNVGLDFGQLIQLHPIDHLFKYEVRALAKELGLPASVYNRQPFPGPGLFLRIIGVAITKARLDLVSWADARVAEILKRHRRDEEESWHDHCSQLVVGLNGVPTVGVKGDGRVYGPSIIVRGVKTADFMTADGIRFPALIKDEIEAGVCQHTGIVRVWYDEMKKPPATTEFE
ncbi:MAG: hypothetical protein A3J07_04920 [Candidatus Doudnabacteria bacterium RIFCSPLOWO2_02_FULL_49_13]|nr:MAG: hypothetical protein A3J07_04920 [Candidatus Doudnabacteria bacterium RIFCSPLOWO2_02_FULL_49_13]